MDWKHTLMIVYSSLFPRWILFYIEYIWLNLLSSLHHKSLCSMLKTYLKVWFTENVEKLHSNSQWQKTKRRHVPNKVTALKMQKSLKPACSWFTRNFLYHRLSFFSLLHWCFGWVVYFRFKPCSCLLKVHTSLSIKKKYNYLTYWMGSFHKFRAECVEFQVLTWHCVTCYCLTVVQLIFGWIWSRMTLNEVKSRQSYNLVSFMEF